MKTTMKKALCVLLAAIWCLFSVPVVSAEDDVLLTLGGKTLTGNMTLADIAAVFGAPKLQTPSAFGGTVATYYEKSGSSYDYYLYIETDAAGQIASYATITPGYTAPNRRSYHDTDSGTVNYKQGCYASDYDDVIWAGCYYTAAADFRAYLQTWQSDPQLYLIGLQKHSAMMYNAAGTVFGKNSFDFEFDEKLFYTNEQLKSTDSNLNDWADATGKSAYVYFIDSGMVRMCNYAYMPNPMLFVGTARNYTPPADNTYACLDVTIKPSGDCFKSTAFVNPAILNPSRKGELTDEEKTLLKRARALYKQSVADFNEAAADGYFETDYQYKSLPLQAGKMREGVLKGTLGYLNAIRAGAGLRELTLSDTLSDRAQHKAVLTAYMAANHITNSNPLIPSQPAGVDDEFYNLCKPAAGENLYYNGMLGGDFVIGSVNNALQEAYGDTIACGHRYNLLDPGWAQVGFGSCNGQGVHEFSGYAASDTDVVCWPSKGIMLTNAVHDSYRWTIHFYGNYAVTEGTTVEITNLNTDTTWVESTSSNDYRIVNSSLISFYDGSITHSVGDVVQVTVKGLIQNGKPAEYSYRTVFATTNEDSLSDESSDVDISATAMTLRAGKTGKLQAKPKDAEMGDRLIQWSSSDENVATVRADGMVTAVAPGTAVIKAVSHADPTKLVTCTVTVVAADAVVRGDVNGDDAVTVVDALMTLQAAAQTLSLEGVPWLAADVDNDSAVTAADALTILQFVTRRLATL